MKQLARRHFSTMLAPIHIGCAYFAVATLSVLSSRFEGGLAFIWGANALVMAQLLTTPTRRWAPTIIACSIASIMATALFGMGPVAAIPLAAINLLEALIVVGLCHRLAPDLRVTGSMRPLLTFIFALCGPANIVAGALAATVASYLTPVSFMSSWLHWYSGHVLGGLTCVPIFIMLIRGELRRWLNETPIGTKVETIALLGFLALVVAHVFFFARYPLLFVPLLPMVLIAFRIGNIGVAASVFILAIIGGSATMAGVGPLTLIPGTLGERMECFQFYVAFSFLLAMPVAAALNGRRRLFRMLEDSEARYRAIAEHSGDLVLNIGADGIIHYASPSAQEQIGCAPGLLIGQCSANLVDPQDRAAVVANHRRALIRPDATHKVEFRPLVSVSNVEWVEMVSRAIVNERGMPSGVVCTIRDISEHKARQQALQRVAARDSLTGADTRRAFLAKLDREIGRVSQDVQSSLLLIDIDHFKAVNDRYGHGAGDLVLSAFVERLRPGLRSVDSIGRLGGEEFAILLVDSDIDRASMICERLRAKMVDPIALGGGMAVTITFSAGLVELDALSDRSEMLEAADKALYRAKRGGRNCLRLAA